VTRLIRSLEGNSRSRRAVFSFEHLVLGLKNTNYRLVDREHPDHMCLSCGKAMRLVRTIPVIGEPPDLRNYECKACGIVFTEAAGRAVWHET
jgi:hypothetical protein